MSHIEVKNLNKVYNKGKENEVKALDDISFSLEKGEFVVILGPSGAGKSTLLNILGGMDEASGGSYLVDGKDVAKFKQKDLTRFRRLDIGFVFQFYNLVPNLSALENIQLAASISKCPFDSLDVLKDVGLEKRATNFPTQLSGGEQQRTSIARAIVKNPELLLCDEPTGALDSKTGANIIGLLYDVCKKFEKTVIIVTHNAKIAEIGERVIHIRDGKIASNEINKNHKNPSEVEW